MNKEFEKLINELGMECVEAIKSATNEEAVQKAVQYMSVGGGIEWN